jgi:hypothetical protein
MIFPADAISERIHFYCEAIDSGRELIISKYYFLQGNAARAREKRSGAFPPANR